MNYFDLLVRVTAADRIAEISNALLLHLYGYRQSFWVPPTEKKKRDHCELASMTKAMHSVLFFTFRRSTQFSFRKSTRSWSMKLCRESRASLLIKVSIRLKYTSIISDVLIVVPSWRLISLLDASIGRPTVVKSLQRHSTSSGRGCSVCDRKRDNDVN